MTTWVNLEEEVTASWNLKRKRLAMPSSAAMVAQRRQPPWTRGHGTGLAGSVDPNAASPVPRYLRDDALTLVW
jgi:hypothetical protein